MEHKISNIEEALQQLGVSTDTLTEEEKNALDEKGYLVLPGILNAGELEELRDKYEELLAKEGMQALHADWGKRTEHEPFHVCNSIWMIDEFTPDNGATRVVPGTHRLPGSPRDYLEDTKAAHPNEVLLTAPAGTVGVFNSHLWHGGTLNRTTRTRRAMHAYYTAREHPQQLHQAEYIRKSTYDRISPAARYILDV